MFIINNFKNGDMMKKLISVGSDAMDWADRNSIIAIHWKYKTISIGLGLLPKPFLSGIRFGLFNPIRLKAGGDYVLKGFDFRLLPALDTAYPQWPLFYRKAFSSMSWRNHDCCGIKK